MSESSEYTGSDTSDEEPQLLVKPVFIKRSKVSAEAHRVENDTENAKQNDPEDPETDAKHKVIRNIQVINDATEQSEVVEHFNGVDDTDGLDPEQEYESWRVREYRRYTRDRQILVDLEDEQSDMLRRSGMTEEELVREFRDRKPVEERSKRQKEKKIDHSRPTRFKS